MSMDSRIDLSIGGEVRKEIKREGRARGEEDQESAWLKWLGYLGIRSWG